ncbi:hypothetical protein BHQ21_05710 [Mycobacterium sherrisii]|uniref:Uncharacterized protein n=1 Tax=Mycobacterium sherrisii TaxID=243061 RepID=A0A1E3T2W2_9MYCO|nr:hypothetical protein BHQ21_05710 [Mycobacterium sherrisii]
MSSGVATAARLKTKRHRGWVRWAVLTIDSNNSVLLATRRTPAPMSTASYRLACRHRRALSAPASPKSIRQLSTS